MAVATTSCLKAEPRRDTNLRNENQYMESHEKLSVRHALMSDLDRLTSLSIEVQRLHSDALPDLFREPNPEALRKYLEKELKLSLRKNLNKDQGETSVLFLVAEQENHSIGYLLGKTVNRSENPFRHSAQVFYVDQLVVARSARRLGAGRKLIEAAETHAIAAGTYTLQLDSWAFNTSAHHFFKQLGFTPINIVLAKELTAD